MRILLTTSGKPIAATLVKNRIADEFIAMLPLTITMHDFFGREKFGALPAAVSSKGTRSGNYEVGDIVCWAPGPDLSILHRQDNRPLDGAWHLLGRIDDGVEVFGEPGAIQVTIEAVPKASDANQPTRGSSSHGSRKARSTLHAEKKCCDTAAKCV